MDEVQNAFAKIEVDYGTKVMIDKLVESAVQNGPLNEFKMTHRERLQGLLEHFNQKYSGAKPYESVEHLMADMLDDVIDVWIETHEVHEDSNHPCTACWEVS